MWPGYYPPPVKPAPMAKSGGDDEPAGWSSGRGVAEVDELLTRALMRARLIKDAATDLYFMGKVTPDFVMWDLYHGVDGVIKDEHYKPVEAELKAVRDIVVVELLDAYFSWHDHIQRFRRWMKAIGF